MSTQPDGSFATVGPKDVAGRSPWQLAWRRLHRDPGAIVATIFIVLLVAMAVCAPLLSQVTGHSGAQPNLDTGTDSNGLPLPPGTWGYLMGTDNLGRDVLVRVAYAAQISLLVGVVATVIATVVGVIVGLIAGFLGGWVDSLISRFMDVVLSFPYVLVALALVAVLGPSIGVAVAVIAFFNWAAIGRVVRGQTLSHKSKEYVEAARSLGASRMRIMFIDILPNLTAPIIVLASLLIPNAILFEATLSFLGLGVVPPTATWGNMLADWHSVGDIGQWWIWVCPSVALLIATVSFNILGDSVRDALDPGTERIFAARIK